MYSDTGDTTSLVPGFPIRTSSDQRSVDSSPRHIAASHVLHRLLMPRHPPCALKHLQHKKTTRTKPADQKISKSCLDARNHYPINKHHTPPPRWSDTTNPRPQQAWRQPGVASGPNSVLGAMLSSTQSRRRFVVAHPAATHYRHTTPHGSSKT